MTLLDCLRRAREAYIKGEHRLLGMLDHTSLVLDAAAGDAELACQALEFLDLVAGGDGEFSRFIDGGELLVEDERAAWVYRYDRAESEVAALFGKACVAATTREAEA